MKIKDLDVALKRISELEEEVKLLKTENEKLRGRNFGGRKKHDEVWMASYNDFVSKLEKGKTLTEIVAEGEISTRTAYRYLSYYKELKENKDK
ncbi:MAG: resolvase [Lachnospiraceae bacterium]|nr:resolvase [Lachnospiraceae bacterium]